MALFASESKVEHVAERRETGSRDLAKRENCDR